MSAPEFKPDDQEPKADLNVPQKQSSFDDEDEQDEPRRKPVFFEGESASSDSSGVLGSAVGGVMGAVVVSIVMLLVWGAKQFVRNDNEDMDLESQQTLANRPQFQNGQITAAENELVLKTRWKVDVIRKQQRENQVSDDRLNAMLKDLWCAKHSSVASRTPWESGFKMPREVWKKRTDIYLRGGELSEHLPPPLPDRLEWIRLVDWDMDAVLVLLPV